LDALQDALALYEPWGRATRTETLYLPAAVLTTVIVLGLATVARRKACAAREI